ncbi:bifunctional phosphoribosylaminoimidazolecarboxamide formyltransferase/IMP cyclohydrolase [bacterium]|jgi:phosphoribosylaminoimidazolecarboxamide formyltransferase/IMP cyclohydrolase|nr:bifunctional phosphoribosylaminoimidazolecarboxamide formyltransferase/IMP cyclohydrolase [bacterium]MDG2445631.1 bifunctional phosphoribosylaminoimidazolecarboxamide formyltransferase/IMP cyclohydrolase [Thermodesulfobacteriota bacterium]|tara:strand:+ start:21372 stop:22940 length:1569 start_codon:yes stop_codon:yes gene_type:complete
MNKIKTALISVWDKTDVDVLAKKLNDIGIEIVSSGGTAKFLRDKGISVKDVSEITNFPEMLDGRVKTLHPKIHAGLLAIRGNKEHEASLKQESISTIDLVIVNFYPFESVIKKDGIKFQEVIENIDIGGPTIVRAAAKNFQDVTVITSPSDYSEIYNQISDGELKVTKEANYGLCKKAYSYVSKYDAAISNHLGILNLDNSKNKIPDTLTLHYKKAYNLRYGENPHQEGSFFVNEDMKESSIANSTQLQGKELSLNNIYDADSCLETVKEFKDNACVIVKHNNPCGVAEHQSLLQAYVDARDCDPISAFGGIVAFNNKVESDVANEIVSTFIEVLVAPSYSDEAIEILKAKPNLRVLQTPELKETTENLMDIKKVVGGILYQDADTTSDEDFVEYSVPTKRKPSEEEISTLLLAWKVCKNVKSNAIVLARDNKTVGIGAGQMNRVNSVQLAQIKSKDHYGSHDSCLASDAFFPFRDGIDEAAKAGVTAIVQPGGSIRDEEVIEAANENNMAMIFVGVRHFKH